MSEPLKELTHADFYARSNDRPRVKWVEHPDYGRVRVRILRGFERNSYDAMRYKVNEETGETKFQAETIWAGLIVRGVAKNDEGERMFPDNDVAEIIKKIEGPMLQWLFDEIQAFNKMRLSDRKILEKNSGEMAANAAGGSVSPDTSA